MESNNPKFDARSLLIGLAAGAGLAAVLNTLTRNPEKKLGQILINRALDQKYHQAQEEGPLNLNGEHRYVIFSDHHKGGRSRADDFLPCEQTYLKALDHYLAEGYTLIILGDAEELWEEPIQKVTDSYQNVFEQEARFHPERLIRVYGNHDISWKMPDTVKQHMESFFPGIVYREDLLFAYHADRPGGGELFLVHGYQGTIESDLLIPVARKVLPYFARFQHHTGIGYTTPSQDACLRSKHDNRLYRWVSKKSKLILIAGHTHRPVWSSKSHLDKLTEELYDLLRLDDDQQPHDYETMVEQKKQEIERKRAEFPPCDDMVKTRPAYFNTGCCSFMDGDITGMELENGVLRLIKWSGKRVPATRTVLEENSLKNIFLYL
jgi:UDP-2,3-diacylglucosamine pyrophosphatase LpxH